MKPSSLSWTPLAAALATCTEAPRPRPVDAPAPTDATTSDARAPTDAPPADRTPFDALSGDASPDHATADASSSEPDAPIDRLDAASVCDALRPFPDRVAADASRDAGACTCAPEANARVACVLGACASTCEDRFARCGGRCLPETASRCGVDCRACVPPPDGTVSCVGGRCEVACDAGLLLWRRRCYPFRQVDLGPLLRAGTHASAAVSGDGVVHMAYRSAEDASATYARQEGCGWRVERIEGVIGATGETLELGVDHGGVPLLLASNVLETRGLAFGRRVAAGWAFEEVHAPGEDAHRGAMAVDVEGQPHVCYLTRGGRLTYALRRGDRWSTRAVDDGSGTQRCALAVASDGSAHVASVRVVGARFTVEYASGGLGGFAQGLVAASTIEPIGPSDGAVSLALDGGDRPRIVYTVVDGPQHAALGPSGWSRVPIPGVNLPLRHALAIDALDRSVVASVNGSVGETLHLDGATWVPTPVPPTSGSLALALTRAPSGAVCAAAVRTGGSTSDVAFARLDGARWSVESVETRREAAPVVSLLQGADGLVIVDVEVAATFGSGARVVVFEQMPDGAWRRSEPLPDEEAREVAAAVDARGGLHLAWQGGPATLRYARREGGVWRVETVPQPSGRLGAPSLAVDAPDQPRIAFADIAGGRVMLAEFDGGAWRASAVAAAFFGVGGDPPVRVRVGPDGATHVVWVSREALYHTARRGGVWAAATTIDGAVGQSYDVMIDGAGAPRVCYPATTAVGGIPTRVARLATWSAGGWTFDRVSGPEETTVASCSIAQGPDGRPWALYSLITTPYGGRLRLGVREPSGWRHATVHEGSRTWLNDLLVDASSRPHVAYLGNPTDLATNSRTLTYATPTR